jgi:vacuolar-type H+-ATPase subunit E/Vma4
MVLDAKQKMIKEVFAAAKAELKAIAKGPGYTELMAELLTQVCSSIGSRSVLCARCMASYLSSSSLRAVGVLFIELRHLAASLPIIRTHLLSAFRHALYCSVRHYRN